MVFHSILSTRIVLHITEVLKQDSEPVDSRSTTLVQRGHLTRIESVLSDALVIVIEEGTKIPNDRLV
jgi:hypothetical protein